MAKPFIKWVGSKSQVVGELVRRMPKSFNRYIEPFCGSASLFFAYFDVENDVFQNDMPPAFLSDSNAALINCYGVVRDSLSDLTQVLDEMMHQHMLSPKEYYAKSRKKWNTGLENPVEFAAHFIYLNKTGFNGLYRVNSKNEFNVPWNQEDTASLYKLGHIKKCSSMLRKYATVTWRDYSAFLVGNAQTGDFVFLDPPYEGVSATSNFTSYTQDKWDQKDTQKLASKLDWLDTVGIKFMMTNSDSPLVYDIFGKWNIDEIKVHRFVKALNGEETREKVTETVITNY